MLKRRVSGALTPPPSLFWVKEDQKAKYKSILKYRINKFLLKSRQLGVTLLHGILLFYFILLFTFFFYKYFMYFFIYHFAPIFYFNYHTKFGPDQFSRLTFTGYKHTDTLTDKCKVYINHKFFFSLFNIFPPL